MAKIFFNNSSGMKLCAELSGKNDKKAVLICHGLGADKDSAPYGVFQSRINRLGLSALAMDFLGHGESEGGYDDFTLTEAIDDVLNAVSELKRRGFEEIGFIGESFGGVAGIMSAERAGFKHMTLISPPTYYDVSEMISSGIFILWELRKFNSENKGANAKFRVRFFKDYGSHDSYAAARKIDAPVLIIHGDSDRIVPLEKSRELHKHIRDSKMKIFKGADHHYSHPLAQQKLIHEVVNFVRKNS